MSTIFDQSTLDTLTDIEQKALRDMAQIQNPVWRRHLEDLAVACNTVIASVMRLRDNPNQAHYSADTSS